eukprot:UN32616
MEENEIYVPRPRKHRSQSQRLSVHTKQDSITENGRGASPSSFTAMRQDSKEFPPAGMIEMSPYYFGSRSNSFPGPAQTNDGFNYPLNRTNLSLMDRFSNQSRAPPVDYSPNYSPNTSFNDILGQAVAKTPVKSMKMFQTSELMLGDMEQGSSGKSVHR